MALQQNVINTAQILNILANLLEQHRVPNNLELQQIRDFNGFGSFSKELLESNPRFLQSIEVSLETLAHYLKIEKQTIFADLKESILTSFYTPDKVVDSIVDALAKDYKNILEPSAGNGRFVDKLSKKFTNSNITAVEKNSLSGLMLRALNHDKPSVKPIIKAFQNIDNIPKQDLIISNIPFGDFPVFDKDFLRDPEKTKFSKKIHSYFCVKGLDSLNNHGDLVYVGPTGIMDAPGNEALRRYLVAKADFITAVRLPNNTFKDANTKVVSDVFILRKNENKQSLTTKDQLFIETESKNFLNVQYNQNSFYSKNPENVLGHPKIGYFYNREQITYEAKEQLNTPLQINKIISEALDIKLIEELPIQTLKNTINKTIDNVSGDFKLFQQLLEKEGYLLRPVLKNKKLLHFVLDPINKSTVENNYILDKVTGISSQKFISQNFFKNVNLTYSKSKSIEKAKTLQTDLFSINGPAIQQQQLSFFDPKVKEIKARDKEDKINPADIRSKSIENIILLHKTIVNNDNQNLDSNQSRADLLKEHQNFLSKYGDLQLKKNETYIEQAFTKEAYLLLTLNKDSDILQPKKQYNVANSIEALDISRAKYGIIHKEFIESLIPHKSWDQITKELIDADLVYKDPRSTTALPIYKDDYLSGNIADKLKLVKLAIEQTNQTELKRNVKDLEKILPKRLGIDEIHVNLGVRWIDPNIYTNFIKNYLGMDITVHNLEQSDKYLFELSKYNRGQYDTKWQVKRFHIDQQLEAAFAQLYPQITYKVDEKTTKVDHQATRELQSKIDELHKSWDKYYKQDSDTVKYIEEKYNKMFNSSVPATFTNPINFDELKIFKPYDHQKSATWRIIHQNGGIMDHIVGSGKTLVMILASYNMKRMGLVKKPMIIAMKANYESIANEYRKAYPSARILSPTLKEFDSKNRRLFLGKMVNNEYDVIILTHDQFGKIPQDYGIQEKLIKSEIKSLSEELQTIKNKGVIISKMTEKGLLKRQLSLEVKLETLSARMKKDEGVPTFKDLGVDKLFVDESQQFKNLEYVTRHIQVAGLGDSIGSQRAFNLLIAARTLQDYHGGDKGITFASGTPISNSLSELPLLFKYLRPQKMKELGMSTFDSWAVQFAKKSVAYELTITADVKKKERFRNFVNLPELVTLYTEIADVRNDSNLTLNKPKLETHLVSVKPTIEQLEFNAELIAFAKAKDSNEIKDKLAILLNRPVTDGDKDAKMLLATNLAKKMSIDLKLVDEHKYKHFVSPKLDQATTKIAKIFQRSTEHKGTQFIFSDTGTPKKNAFDVYNEVKRLLILKGIPPEQIAFIHSYNTDKRKKDLFDMVNNGSMRIVLGSTQKMGTGVNMQKRNVAIHHLDIPWRPSDVEQRNGRGARQGNHIAKEFYGNQVDSYFYATEKTLDAYQFELLKNKQTFISQVKDNSLGIRKIDEGGEEALNYAEYVAALTGNDDLLKLTKIDHSIAELEAQKKVFYSNLQNLDNQIQKSENKIERLEKPLKLYQSEKKELLVKVANQDLSTYDFKMELKNKELNLYIKSEKVNEYGEHIANFFESLKAPIYPDKDYSIGEELGFTLIASKSKFGIDLKLHSQSSRLTYTPDNIIDSPNKAGMFLRNTLRKILIRPENTLIAIDEEKKQLSFLVNQKNDKTFSKEDQLNILYKEKNVINLKLDSDLSEKQSLER